jgi:hypothetical protein
LADTELGGRGVKIGAATSVRKADCEAASIFLPLRAQRRILPEAIPFCFGR